MSLIVEKRGAAGWIVLNQPQKRNAINDAMWRSMSDAVAGFDSDPAVRCLVFRGSGTEAFASGADISEFDKIRADHASGSHYESVVDRLLHAIQGSHKPSVALIHGFCLGGGLELALACDLRYCGRSAQFGIPAAKLSIPYSVEGHKRLLETVGHARAREIMFLGRRYPAEEGLAMGLVHKVLEDSQLESFVAEVVKTLCENSPLAIANSKTQIEEYVKSAGHPDHARMQEAIARCAKSADYEEGRRAFMEKRKPRFTGA